MGHAPPKSILPRYICLPAPTSSLPYGTVPAVSAPITGALIASLVHFGAVVSDAPSPLSTPRSAAGQAQLRLGKPLRQKCRASPVLLFWRAGRVVAGTVGIVRATVPFHGEHDALEPTKEGLRFSTVRLPTPRCVCVSVNLFSLSLAATAAAVCAASPGPPCSGGCRVPAPRALPLPALALLQGPRGCLMRKSDSSYGRGKCVGAPVS